MTQAKILTLPEDQEPRMHGCIRDSFTDAYYAYFTDEYYTSANKKTTTNKQKTGVSHPYYVDGEVAEEVHDVERPLAQAEQQYEGGNERREQLP